MSTYNRALDRDENGRLKRRYRRPPFPMSTPSHWVRDHMNRPRRRQNRRLCRLVTRGHDPEGLSWPLGNRRPHLYYW
ncbi:MAG: hypothetical protein ACT4P0_13405 [Panacagrimonas sp.]